MSAETLATLWRSRVAHLFISIRQSSGFTWPALDADSLARVNFLLAHPFRWTLPALGAFLACSPEGVGPESRWPSLLDGFDRAIAEVVPDFGRGAS